MCESKEHPQRCRLACTIVTHQAEDLTGLDGKGHGVNGLYCTETLPKAAKVDRSSTRVHGSSFSPIATRQKKKNLRLRTRRLLLTGDDFSRKALFCSSTLNLPYS